MFSVMYCIDSSVEFFVGIEMINETIKHANNKKEHKRSLFQVFVLTILEMCKFYMFSFRKLQRERLICKIYQHCPHFKIRKLCLSLIQNLIIKQWLDLCINAVVFQH